MDRFRIHRGRDVNSKMLKAYHKILLIFCNQENMKVDAVGHFFLASEMTLGEGGRILIVCYMYQQLISMILEMEIMDIIMDSLQGNDTEKVVVVVV